MTQPYFTPPLAIGIPKMPARKYYIKISGTTDSAFRVPAEGYLLITASLDRYLRTSYKHNQYADGTNEIVYRGRDPIDITLNVLTLDEKDRDRLLSWQYMGYDVSLMEFFETDEAGADYFKLGLIEVQTWKILDVRAVNEPGDVNIGRYSITLKEKSFTDTPIDDGSGFSLFKYSFTIERDGSPETGTATAGTSTTLTDGAKSWTPNEWEGYTLSITGGTGIGQKRIVISNNATSVTISNAFDIAPDGTSTYSIGVTFFVPSTWDPTDAEGSQGLELASDPNREVRLRFNESNIAYGNQIIEYKGRDNLELTFSLTTSSLEEISILEWAKDNIQPIKIYEWSEYDDMDTATGRPLAIVLDDVSGVYSSPAFGSVDPIQPAYWRIKELSYHQDDKSKYVASITVKELGVVTP